MGAGVMVIVMVVFGGFKETYRFHMNGLEKGNESLDRIELAIKDPVSGGPRRFHVE